MEILHIMMRRRCPLQIFSLTVLVRLLLEFAYTAASLIPVPVQTGSVQQAPNDVFSSNIFMFILSALLLPIFYSSVFFGDISDFTAWSKFLVLSAEPGYYPEGSVQSLPNLTHFPLLLIAGSTRDPSQVFILLQTIYQAFDELAKRRNVFKVETIGDR